MSGPDGHDIPKLTGIKKYFNSYTTQGRANVALAVYASLAVGVIYYKLKPKKSAT